MLQKEEILSFIRQNKKLLEDRFSVEKIALFGSYARDEQTDQSDIDLLVTLRSHTAEVHKTKEGLREFFLQNFHCSIDIASEKYLKPYIRNEILHEAQYA